MGLLGEIHGVMGLDIISGGHIVQRGLWSVDVINARILMQNLVERGKLSIYGIYRLIIICMGTYGLLQTALQLSLWSQPNSLPLLLMSLRARRVYRIPYFPMSLRAQRVRSLPLRGSSLPPHNPTATQKAVRHFPQYNCGRSECAVSPFSQCQRGRGAQFSPAPVHE